tara:strand:- start:409 stop:1590 length:1182 start_codon:yes stop_codon:yes gene_type:complete
MNNISSEIFLELGSSKIILSFNDKINNKIKSKEKNILNDQKQDSLFLNLKKNKIENIIYELEKENNIYIKNINLLVDDKNLITIGLSVSKQINHNLFEKKDLEYLIQDAKQILLKFNNQYEILHILITSFKADDNDCENFYNIEKCNKISLDLLFICIPLKKIEFFKKLFSNNHININKILSSSYSKSFYLINNSDINYENKIFIDIGFEKTAVLFYKKKILKYFNIIPIGSNHVNKDLIKILNIDYTSSEYIKKNFYKKNFLQDKKYISIINDFKINKKNEEIIYKIIKYRIDEILELSLKKISEQLTKFDSKAKIKLILLGKGSKVFNFNSISLEKYVPVTDEIDIYKDEDFNIYDCGYFINSGSNPNEVILVPKKTYKKGFFEKLFHFLR